MFDYVCIYACPPPPLKKKQYNSRGSVSEVKLEIESDWPVEPILTWIYRHTDIPIKQKT